MKLNLDFSIASSTDRLDYLNTYLRSIPNSSLTNANLETLANYVLWAQKKEDPNLPIEVDSRNSPWTRNRPLSLESLIEQSETTGMPFNQIIADSAQTTKKRKLDRAEVMAKPHFEEMRSIWETLWRNIDETEYIVQTYELQHGKRRPDLPIREELFQRLSAHGSDIVKLNDIAAVLSGYDYLKKKRNLVELRKTQYTYLDNLNGEVIQCHMNSGIYWQEREDREIQLLPFNSPKLIIDEVREENFSKEFNDVCIAQLRRQDEYAAKSFDNGAKVTSQSSDDVATITSNTSNNDVFDMRNVDHIRILLSALSELVYETENKNVKMILKYFNYYVKKCNFTPELMFILKAKIHKKNNKWIVEQLKKHYGFDYKENYISTIYTKRIIQAIADAATEHYNLIEFILMGKAVFKTCTRCGKMLPRNATYFNKRSSTSDGFFGYCKNCKRGAND